MEMIFITSVLASLWAGSVSAIFTVDCRVLTTARIDPIVSPGSSTTEHVHSIVGASSFNPNSNFDSLRMSKCTTCNVKEVLKSHIL